ncbi:hypothetical protein P7H42_10030 [Vagococcus lutrae]|uniref:plasmid mobilization protein n=1 Tax=Vagococcus lutrae TaxID=81947 RepID=UPI00288FD1AB|nr:hypothetical protein [Vagococcus lutrae]MDT2820070.1 hypothetical protein [Vagococcus lutrae]MDT2845007.1 hypothetical protein [Vagococcus lutrae]
MKKRKDSLKISVTTKEKEAMKKKAKELGFGSVSAFLLDASETYFRLNVDMSVYRKLMKEINYIGKNINALVRSINTDRLITDLDIYTLEKKLEEIKELMMKEYMHLSDLQFNFTSDKLTENDTIKMIEAFQKNNLDVPKKVLLEEVYENIHGSFALIIDMIRTSKYQDELIEEYVWDFIHSSAIDNLSDDDLIRLSDKLFKYYEKLRLKAIDLDYHFTDEDWFNLLEIIDEFEE